ncbi:hypothetical protein ACWD4V_16135 [Streptomyces tsukubensis]|uniref:hypothetical protein n=1 Tax=Streptomyces tsukubensis TaxID=83656 RepID=UPI0036BC61BA
MAYVHETETPESAFVCVEKDCDGVIEANAMGWLNIDKGDDGNPILSVFGFSEGDYAVKCSECGQDANEELEKAIYRLLIGSDGKDWFRG